MKSLAHILAILVASLALPCSAQSAAEEQDAEVIENLRASGSDVSKPHELDFFLYFPSEENAKSAARELNDASYTVVGLESTDEGGVWQVHAKRTMVPELETINASTRALNALAARHDGDYDGWGTAVVK